MLFVIFGLLFAMVVAGDCAADDCLRALQATQTPSGLQSAQSFCATFTRSSVAATAIPSFASSGCTASQDAPMLARISSACSCIAATTSSVQPLTSTTSTMGACALVSSSSSAQRALSPTATPTVAANLAHDCLNSVPLNKTAAIELVDAMQPYLEWQSDIAYKKDPPADYFYPAHDIFAYLASVKSNLENDNYSNEYEFQEDLYQVFSRGHDGHFIFYPDALSRAFEWGRGRSLVSISEDGTSLPVIKLYEDVISSPSTASVVAQINGMDAATYVAGYAYTASFNQDADAAYNSMFYEKAFVAGGVSKGYFSGGGRMRYIYPGASTTFTFENGTNFTLDNIAKVKGNFGGVNSGESYYQQFCTGATASSGSVAAIAATGDLARAVGTIATGYPSPVIITGDSIVSGYYLNETGYEDVAVISLLAFENEAPLEFQRVAQQFFADAKQDGKTKLVIDLSANGGGYILQGYDLFRQLFPDIVQDGFTRFRESDTLLAMSQIYSDISADFDPITATEDEINIYETFFNYRYDLNSTDEPFESFGAKFDPHVYKGDDYTNIMRWNLTDTLTTSNESYGLGTDITGYNTRTNFTQPFEADNIIMLYDGYCASTCTLFSEFMRIQAGVKSVAMGGRPRPGPIQGVGGIKGAQILTWSSILTSAQTALKNATDSQAAILKRLTQLPIDRSTSNGINVRDQILRDNLDDGLPAQYVVEEADCRLYWTQEMIGDVTAVWKAAADAAFNGKACVAGGIEKRKREVGEERRERKSRAEGRRALNKLRDASLKRDSSAEMSPEWLTRHRLKAIP